MVSNRPGKVLEIVDVDLPRSRFDEGVRAVRASASCASTSGASSQVRHSERRSVEGTNEHRHAANDRRVRRRGCRHRVDHAQRWDRYRSFVITVVNLSLFFVIWQLIALSGIINPLFFPKATDMFSAMYHGFADGTIGPELLHSVQNFTIGMLIAAAIGIPLGLLMGGVRSSTWLSPLDVGDDRVAARRPHSPTDPHPGLR